MNGIKIAALLAAGLYCTNIVYQHRRRPEPMHNSWSPLSNQRIHPYTDLLLHDMGTAAKPQKPKTII